MKKIILLALLVGQAILLTSCGGGSKTTKIKEYVLNEKPEVYVHYSLYPGEEKTFSVPSGSKIGITNDYIPWDTPVEHYKIVGENIDKIDYRFNWLNNQCIIVECLSKIEDPVKINEIHYIDAEDQSKIYIVKTDITFVNDEDYKMGIPTLMTLPMETGAHREGHFYNRYSMGFLFADFSVGAMNYVSGRFIDAYFANEDIRISKVEGYKYTGDTFINFEALGPIDDLDLSFDNGYWIVFYFERDLDKRCFYRYDEMTIEIEYNGDIYKIKKEVFI